MVLFFTISLVPKFLWEFHCLSPPSSHLLSWMFFMSLTKRFALILWLFAFTPLCESTSGIEIYVTSESVYPSPIFSTYPLGKITIDGSNIIYSEIKNIDATNQVAYDNLSWSNTANAFYSVSTQPKLTKIDTAGDIQGTPVNSSPLIIGLAVDNSNDTLYTYRQTDDTFGTINKTNGIYSSI